MKKYYKLVVGSLLFVGGLVCLVHPYYNCVFWGCLSGVVFVLWFFMDKRRQKFGK
jgi:hypothetical protein